jgi:hypothetical protein
MKYLFLDDYRIPSDVTWDKNFPLGKQWFIVRDIDQFKMAIDNCLEEIEHVAFDHDLALEHYTGMGNVSNDGRTGLDCAKYLIEQCIEMNIPLPSFSSHSMNPAGRDNILSLLSNFQEFQKHN